jgi:hypothetical protein
MFSRDRGFSLNPKTADDVNQEKSIQGMRQRLFRYQRDNPLVRTVMDAAHYKGLSGEDTMTWLAYESLKRLEFIEDRCIEDALLNVNQFIPTAPTA